MGGRGHQESFEVTIRILKFFIPCILKIAHSLNLELQYLDL